MSSRQRPTACIFCSGDHACHPGHGLGILAALFVALFLSLTLCLSLFIADRREFIKISQAVGMGFLIMGAIGYIIKLSMSLLPPAVSQYLKPFPESGRPSLLTLLSTTTVHIPVNNVLVG